MDDFLIAFLVVGVAEENVFLESHATWVNEGLSSCGEGINVPVWFRFAPTTPVQHMQYPPIAEG